MNTDNLSDAAPDLVMLSPNYLEPRKYVPFGITWR